MVHLSPIFLFPGLGWYWAQCNYMPDALPLDPVCSVIGSFYSNYDFVFI
jgi:hypothetical protein